MAPYRQTSFDAYDSYGRLTQSTEQSSGGSPWQIVHKTWYVWDDAVSPSVSGSSGEYVIDRVAFSDTEDVRSRLESHPGGLDDGRVSRRRRRSSRWLMAT